jgi:outer membrane protein OmpA-like peptidoglycan-associated protein
MNQRIPLRRTTVLAAVVIMFAVTATMVAQTQKVEGLIKARSGSEMVVQTKNNTDLVVILTDSTDVAQLQGMLKARKKMSMAALIPGLAVQVEGTSNTQNQLVATKVRFKGNDLEQAQSMEAAMHETKLTNQQQQEELAKQNAELQAHKEALQAQQAQINANKAAINEAVAKFGQLDDYYIFDELTVYFGNGKTTVDPKYVPQLTELAQKAAKINGYIIEVKGYASSSAARRLTRS